MSEPIQPSKAAVAATAQWTAAARAKESAREDRLFEDPFAAALAGKEGIEWAAQRRTEALAPMVFRTRYFDDFLKRASSSPSIRQIVLLAAGLDARAYRLPWPERTRLFELDQANVLEYKDEVLRSFGAHPSCARQAIAADVAGDWAAPLSGSGFDPGRPTCWILEGILFYFPIEVVERILADVSRLSSRGSWLGFDVPNRATFDSALTRPWLEMQARAGAPWMSAMDAPEKQLGALGWDASLTQFGAPEINFGRWPFPVAPIAVPGIPRHWLVEAHRR